MIDKIRDAVGYYVATTGCEWHDFYSGIDRVMRDEDVEGSDWYLRGLLHSLIRQGVSLSVIKSNKDVIKMDYAADEKKNAGEFFTPVAWAEKFHEYMDGLVPGWCDGMTVWEGSAGSGNLIRSAGLKGENLVISTLQDDDVEFLRSCPEFEGAEIFQLDFLSGYDGDWSYDFLDMLPERLRGVIERDEPLVLLMNPPYKGGMGSSTVVGRVMQASPVSSYLYDGVNFSGPSFDLFFQFCFQVMNLVARHNLKNCYYCFLGPLSFYEGNLASILLKEFRKCFSFEGGFCFSAGEFFGTESSWGITASVWKSRGGYLVDADISDGLVLDVLERRGGEIVKVGESVAAQSFETLREWVEGAIGDVAGYESAPLCTSHLTFSGGKFGELVAVHDGVVVSDGYLGCMMNANTVIDGKGRCAVLSLPCTIEYTCITESNFWHSVASHVARLLVDSAWWNGKKGYSAPRVDDRFRGWLIDALPYFLFGSKSLMVGLRGVEFGGYTDYVVYNHFYPLSGAEVVSLCGDDVLRGDFNKNGLRNDFLLGVLRDAESKFCPEARELYSFCMGVLKDSLKDRSVTGYTLGLGAVDAGFCQVRGSELWNTELEREYRRRLGALRTYLRKDLDSFGFIL